MCSLAHIGMCGRSVVGGQLPVVSEEDAMHKQLTVASLGSAHKRQVPRPRPPQQPELGMTRFKGREPRGREMAAGSTSKSRFFASLRMTGLMKRRTTRAHQTLFAQV